MQPINFVRRERALSRARHSERLTVRLIINVDRWIYRFTRRWLSAVNTLLFGTVAAIVIAPVLAGFGYTGAARPIYALFSLVCYQPERRSYHLMGHKLAVCHRCTAIYGSLFAFGLLFSLVRGKLRRPRNGEIAALVVPIMVDGSAVGLGVYDGNLIIRTITGILFGFAMIWLLYPRFEAGFIGIRERLEALFARLVAEGRAAPIK